MRCPLSIASGLFASLLLLSQASAEAKPNVLIIMADDCTFSDLPLYGGQNAKTPNIDRLAQSGMVFERAYLATAMCQPCRAELFTGQYPMRNGCAWNHSASRPETTSIPHHLGKLGYRVGIAGKVHVKPQSVFPFEMVGGFEQSCVRNPTAACKVNGIQEFMSRDADEPFCLVVALVDPHVPWVMGDASQYPPAKLKLPPHVPDTDVMREAFSRYLAEITYMDGQVGQILATLETLGAADNTLVLFTSEQGAQMPGCKWTNWDTGVHTALVARWPGKVSEGTNTNTLVQYADVLPTLVDLAGEDVANGGFDGISFKQTLLNQKPSGRQYVFGSHNNHPEGPSYPIRSVTDGKFHYIRNLTPDRLYIEKHLMGVLGKNGRKPYWQSLMYATESDPAAYRLMERYMRRPAVELYDLSVDPAEMMNLAGDPKYATRQQALSDALDAWMKEQGDPGAEQDTHESLNAARKGKHRFVPPEEITSEEK